MKHIYWVIDNELGGRAGPQLYPWTARELIQAGIGAVVSLAGGVKYADLRAAGIEVLPVPQPMILLEDEPQRERFLDIMPLVVHFIDKARGAGRGTLVHCHYGRDRTGAVLACYLVEREGLSPDEAVARVRAANPLALAAPGYPEAVTTFRRLLDQRERGSSAKDAERDAR